jgi:hypothetical protein
MVRVAFFVLKSMRYLGRDVVEKEIAEEVSVGRGLVGYPISYC